MLSYTFKGHIDPSSQNSHIILHNVTLDMHGSYKCSVRTDLGQHEMDQELTVISSSHCRLNDWRVVSEPSKCRELFKLDCRNMFPKPVASCGLWNGKLDKFIRSVMLDISEEPNKQTFRVRYVDQFELPARNATQALNSDLLQFAGHLVFKCDIIVPETSWKLSLVHQMFNHHDGCHQDPLEAIERMRMQYSQYAAAKLHHEGYLLDTQLDHFEMLASTLKYQLAAPLGSPSSSVELNCWQRPRLGSLARLSCLTSQQASQVKLVGANLLECTQSGWIPVANARKLIGKTSKVLAAPISKLNVSHSGEVESSTELAGNSLTDLETSTEVETIPTSVEPESADSRALSQAEAHKLASLLPTCVSSKRLSQPTNRLAMNDEAARSASGSGSGRQLNPQPVRETKRLSVFNFASAGSASSLGKPEASRYLLMFLLTLWLTLRLYCPSNNSIARSSSSAKQPTLS